MYTPNASVSAELFPSISADRAGARNPRLEREPGPWLVLGAPISLALTLLWVIYLSTISF